MNRHDARIGLGAICILAGALMFAVSGATVKAIDGGLKSEAIVFWRSAISVLLLTP